MSPLALLSAVPLLSPPFTKAMKSSRVTTPEKANTEYFTTNTCSIYKDRKHSISIIVLDILVGTRTSKKRTLKRTLVAFSVCVNLKKDPVLVQTNISRTILTATVHYQKRSVALWYMGYNQIIQRPFLFLSINASSCGTCASARSDINLYLTELMLLLSSDTITWHRWPKAYDRCRPTSARLFSVLPWR